MSIIWTLKNPDLDSQPSFVPGTELFAHAVGLSVLKVGLSLAVQDGWLITLPHRAVCILGNLILTILDEREPTVWNKGWGARMAAFQGLTHTHTCKFQGASC